VIAWWAKATGIIIAAASLAGFFIFLFFYPGMEYMAGYSLLVGPINLFNAVTGGHGTDPSRVSLGSLFASWILTAPLWLFIASWLLQRKSLKLSALQSGNDMKPLKGAAIDPNESMDVKI
jgi:hypothetical protein